MTSCSGSQRPKPIVTPTPGRRATEPCTFLGVQRRIDRAGPNSTLCNLISDFSFGTLPRPPGGFRRPFESCFRRCFQRSFLTSYRLSFARYFRTRLRLSLRWSSGRSLQMSLRKSFPKYFRRCLWMSFPMSCQKRLQTHLRRSFAYSRFAGLCLPVSPRSLSHLCLRALGGELRFVGPLRLSV